MSDKKLTARSEKRYLSAQASARLTPGELAELRERADEAHLSVSSYIRSCLDLPVVTSLVEQL